MLIGPSSAIPLICCSIFLEYFSIKLYFLYFGILSIYLFLEHLFITFSIFFWNIFVALFAPDDIIDRFPSDVTTHPAWLSMWSVFHFKIINNIFNTEFPIRIITVTTTSAISSGLRPQSPLDLASISTISPSYSSSISSRGEYNTLKWRSESKVYGNSIHMCKKISTLKISAEACSLIFLLWEITCKKMPPSTKQAVLTAHFRRFVTSREIGLFTAQLYTHAILTLLTMD